MACILSSVLHRLRRVTSGQEVSTKGVCRRQGMYCRGCRELPRCSIIQDEISHTSFLGGVPAPLAIDMISTISCQLIGRLRARNIYNWRTSAFEMIAELSRNAGKDDYNKPSFKLPAILLKCAVNEDEKMQPCVTLALEALLRVYKRLALLEPSEAGTKAHQVCSVTLTGFRDGHITTLPDHDHARQPRHILHVDVVVDKYSKRILARESARTTTKWRRQQRHFADHSPKRAHRLRSQGFLCTDDSGSAFTTVAIPGSTVQHGGSFVVDGTCRQ
jgi:hypothetical protein